MFWIFLDQLYGFNVTDLPGQEYNFKRKLLLRYIIVKNYPKDEGA